jgi:hypothetical protein
MGSVTYRMLCLSSTLVLALPPKRAEVVTTAQDFEVVTVPAVTLL